jgi:hypothetical protein
MGVARWAPVLWFALAACGSGEVAQSPPASTPSPAAQSSSSAPPQAADPPPGSSAASPDTAAAEAFGAYAQGGPPDVPWAPTVVYRIGGDRVARFDADLADRRPSWNGCPPGMRTYEGRDCPVSPLRTIAQAVREGGQVTYDSDPPGRVVGCNRYRWAGVTQGTTWIRPPRDQRDCFSDFAVAVSLDRSGRVRAVDLTLSGP